MMLIFLLSLEKKKIRRVTKDIPGAEKRILRMDINAQQIAFNGAIQKGSFKAIILVGRCLVLRQNVTLFNKYF